MKVLIAIVTLACLVLAAHGAGCRYNPNGHQNLDWNRYNGQWYLIETGPISANQSGPLNCVYEGYQRTVSDHVWNMTWHGQTNAGEIIWDNGLVTLPNAEMKSTFEVYMDGTVFHSKVLSTDYNSWAIEYSCHEGLGWERFMLRSRARTLPQAVWQALHQVINSYGVDVRDFAVVNHNVCQP